MNESVTLEGFGELSRKRDYWDCSDAITSIGSVDLQVDTAERISDEMRSQIVGALSRVDEIDSKAREYLNTRAPEDVRRAGNLREPSILFVPGFSAGSFTIFYSSDNPDDLTCYGVEFRNHEPFDLTIGD